MSNINKAIKPKWSLHDLYNNIEHGLYESYIVEFTDISGIEVDYYIRNEAAIDSDRLYGEPLYQNILYNPARRTKVLYDTTEEPTLTGPFGIVSEDQIQYAFQPKFTFSRDVSGSGHLPKPGDVIKTIWNDRAYELVDVGEEAHIFQLNKLVFEYILRPYRFSEQSGTAKAISPFNVDPTDQLDSTLISPLSAYGDNEFIEDESDAIDNYSDLDTSIYGY